MNEIIIPGYTLKKKIGEGGSRIAYLANRELLKTDVVVKVFKKERIHKIILNHREQHLLEDILATEVNALRQFSHHNIIRYFNHGKVNDTFFIEEEYMDGGTLLSHINELEESQAAMILFEILKGINYVHNRGIVLRDLKLNNILVSSCGSEVKLDDLELCGNLKNFLKVGTYTYGSENYCAPEIYHDGASVQTDIFALGKCFLFMLTKGIDNAYKLDIKSKQAYNRLLEKKISELDKRYRDVLFGCLAFEPEKRFENSLAVMDALVDANPIFSTLLGSESWCDNKQVYKVNKLDDKVIIIRNANDSDMENMVKLYSNVFKAHNIFTKPKQQVIDYLRSSNQTYVQKGGGYIVCEQEGNINGALLLRIEDFDYVGKHIRLVFNHIGIWERSRHEQILPLLLEVADLKVKNLLRLNKLSSAKIRINLASSEYNLLRALENHNFEVEGQIKHYYRKGEHTLILGKLYEL